MEEDYHAPHNPPHIKLHIKNVARMLMLKLPYHLPRSHIPQLHRPIIACTDQPSTGGVEGQSANESVVPNEGLHAFASGSGPYLYLTVIRTGNDEVVLW